jgi:hypothetical protein
MVLTMVKEYLESSRWQEKVKKSASIIVSNKSNQKTFHDNLNHLPCDNQPNFDANGSSVRCR